MNVRSLEESDFELVAAFLAEDEAQQFGRPSRLGVVDVEAWLGDVDLERDSWLLEDEGLLVALAWVETRGPAARRWAWWPPARAAAASGRSWSI